MSNRDSFKCSVSESRFYCMNPGNLKVYYVGFRETRGVQLVAICTGLLISVKSNYGCAKKKKYEQKCGFQQEHGGQK